MPACTLCPAGKYQPTPGSPVCDEVSNKQFVAITLTGERQEGTCPLPGIDPEFTCSGGELKFKMSGFWHDGLVQNATQPNVFVQRPDFVPSQSMRFYDCPTKSNCQVSESSGAITCIDNSAGVLCALCSQGYTSGSALGSGSSCIKCPSSVSEVLWPWLLLCVVLGATAVLWNKRGKQQWAVFKQLVLKGHDLGLVVLCKLALGFYQVALLMPSVFEVPFPSLYLGVLQMFQWFAFEPPFQSFECFMPTNYHVQMYTAACFAFAVMVVLLVGVAQQAASQRGGGGGSGSSSILSYFIVPSYLVYPSVSAVFLETLKCREINFVEFLSKDLTIECASDAHKSATAVAGLMIFIFSIGLVAVYLALLYPHRTDLSVCPHLSFLFHDYKPQFWYWESIEIARKLVLTGALATFNRGSHIQLVLAMSIIVLHMLVLAHLKPYKKARDGNVALFVYTLLLMMFLGAALLSTQAALPDHLFSESISTPMLAGLLIFALLSVLVVIVVFALSDIRDVAAHTGLSALLSAIVGNTASFATQDRIKYDSVFTNLVPGRSFQQLLGVCSTLVRDLAPSSPGSLRQCLVPSGETTTAEHVVAAAKQHNDRFHEMMRLLLFGREGEYLAGPMKTQSRIEQKAESDYALEAGENDPYSRIIDAVRGTCRFDSADGMLAFISNLKAQNGNGSITVLRVKDRICTNPVSSGYRDCLMNIRVDGDDESEAPHAFVCELQLQFTEYNALKETYGHRTYENIRVMSAHSAVLQRSLHDLHDSAARSNWKFAISESDLLAACATGGSGPDLAELCSREWAAHYKAVLEDYGSDRQTAVQVCAASLASEFCKVLKGGRTLAAHAAASGNLEALTVMHRLGLHLDALVSKGKGKGAASSAPSTISAATQEHITRLQRTGPVDVAAKIHGLDVARTGALGLIAEMCTGKASATDNATERDACSIAGAHARTADNDGLVQHSNPMHSAKASRGEPTAHAALLVISQTGNGDIDADFGSSGGSSSGSGSADAVI
jgi:hypothetical protein